MEWIKQLNKSDSKYIWHKWFAWYPVCVELDSTGDMVFIWLETVERILHGPSLRSHRKIGGQTGYKVSTHVD